MSDRPVNSNRPIVLLGPQREQHTVAAAMQSLGIRGPVATVTAGWEEREDEDAELSEHVGGRTRNLGLYPRAEEVFHDDPEVRSLLYERYDRLRELQTLYRLRLAPQLHACRELFARLDEGGADGGTNALVDPEIADAIAGVRRLDAHHFGRARALDTEIAERIAARERPSIARHREELGRVIDGTDGLLIAGGHVGILLNRLRLFGVLELAGERPVIAWSGGAMVLSERIVLFHDSPPQGPGDPEVYAPGLGLVRGIVPLPHARHRLRLDDPARVALFARRFAPDTCAALDGGEVLEGVAGGRVWSCDGTRILGPDGSVREQRAA